MEQRYIVGTSGWNYSHWKKNFYPEDIKKKDWFRYYTRYFDTVELNNTFYRWPSEKALKNWKEQAPAGFKYTIKAPRLITHLKRLKDPDQYVPDFYSSTDELGNSKGCHLFQLPPSFKKTETNIERLRAFLEKVDGRKDNAVEFRDPSWWSDEIYEICNSYKVIFCSVFGLEMPDQIIKTSEKAYVRFHGLDYSTKYSEQEISVFAERIKALEAKKTFVYFNNDANAYAVFNALQLKEELRWEIE